jgi:hypothetical protein
MDVREGALKERGRRWKGQFPTETSPKMRAPERCPSPVREASAERLFCLWTLERTQQQSSHKSEHCKDRKHVQVQGKIHSVLHPCFYGLSIARTGALPNQHFVYASKIKPPSLKNRLYHQAKIMKLQAEILGLGIHN